LAFFLSEIRIISMNYKETINWIFNQLPMYQNQGASAYRKDLDNTRLLVNHLNNPEKELVCIHVAGTNGKGSTSHLLASILQEAGYKVGLYTSPHLKDYRERIKINGKKISQAFVIDFIEANKLFFEAQQLSFFEMTVGLAFEYFRKKKTQIAIIEVGMGGRLDSTNIVTPQISVITNIGMDHMQFLGNTLEAIAFEKAGIIKPKIPVVIGEYTNETKPVFEEQANRNQAPIYFASDEIETIYKSTLVGDYQEHNIKTVLKTIAVLNGQNKFKVSNKQIKEGLLNVIKNTDLRGRWEQIHVKPLVICDTAHNKEGLQIVLNQISNQKFESLQMVVGVVNDKNLDEILPLFPKNAHYYFCKPNIARGLSADLLKEKAQHYGLIGESYTSVKKAYKAALSASKEQDFIYVGGSTFVVAEVI
jgi:dihydrofolate synthase / folylpolyglutamate synthase